MLHFPEKWLDFIREALALIDSTAGAALTEVPIDQIASLELYCHTALFAARKLEESTGVDLLLKSRSLKVSYYPATETEIANIVQTPNPNLEAWYTLTIQHSDNLSYKQVIDVFIHARLFHFTFVHPDSPKGSDAIECLVASDKYLRNKILKVSMPQVATLLRHTIETMEPFIERRKARRRRSRSDMAK